MKFEISLPLELVTEPGDGGEKTAGGSVPIDVSL